MIGCFTPKNRGREETSQPDPHSGLWRKLWHSLFVNLRSQTMKLLLLFILLTAGLTTGKKAWMVLTNIFQYFSAVQTSEAFLFFFLKGVQLRVKLTCMKTDQIFSVQFNIFIIQMYCGSRRVSRTRSALGPKVICVQLTCAQLVPVNTCTPVWVWAKMIFRDPVLLFFSAWNRLPQSAERLPAVWGQRAGSYRLELSSSAAAARPEPGGLRHTLLTVFGLQVSVL